MLHDSQAGRQVPQDSATPEERFVHQAVVTVHNQPLVGGGDRFQNPERRQSIVTDVGAFLQAVPRPTFHQGPKKAFDHIDLDVDYVALVVLADRHQERRLVGRTAAHLLAEGSSAQVGIVHFDGGSYLPHFFLELHSFRDLLLDQPGRIQRDAPTQSELTSRYLLVHRHATRKSQPA